MPNIITKFGQVDIEFTFQHHRIRSGNTSFDPSEFSQFCKASVDKYSSFLAACYTSKERYRVYVSSINPPCLSDETWATGYVNANWQLDHDMTSEEARRLTQEIQKLEIPRLSLRTEMHREFNTLLRTKVNSLGFKLIDDFEIYINSETGVVDQRFVGPPAGSDWHLYRDAVAPTVMGYIRQILKSSL